MPLELCQSISWPVSYEHRRSVSMPLEFCPSINRSICYKAMKIGEACLDVSRSLSVDRLGEVWRSVSMSLEAWYQANSQL